MSIIPDTLITDRARSDVYRLQAIERKQMGAWTADERYYYLYGDPEPLSATDGDLYATDGLLTVGSGVIKGAYNSSDMNRVERAVAAIVAGMNRGYAALKALAASLGVAWSDTLNLPFADGYALSTKTSWAKGDLPTQSDMARYLGNVAALAAALPAVYPALPSSMIRLNWDGANRIEASLLVSEAALETAIQTKAQQIRNTAAAWVYSGTIYAGMR